MNHSRKFELKCQFFCSSSLFIRWNPFWIDLPSHLNSIHYSFNLCRCAWIFFMNKFNSFYCFCFFFPLQLFWFNFEIQSKRPTDQPTKRWWNICFRVFIGIAYWIEGTLGKTWTNFNLKRMLNHRFYILRHKQEATPINNCPILQWKPFYVLLIFMPITPRFYIRNK